MDTLIDNRNFPIEMQDRPEPSEHKSTTPWLLIVLVLIGLGILAYVAYTIFSPKKSVETAIPTTIPLEQRVEIVDNFASAQVELTPEERQKKINTFFNN